MIALKECVKVAPTKYESFIYIDTRPKYQAFLVELKAQFSADEQTKFAEHKTSPFCWLEMSDGTKTALGGGDDFRAWSADQLPESSKLQAMNPGAPKKPA